MAKKPIKITEVVLRDAHQSLLATRMTMDEMRALPRVNVADLCIISELQTSIKTNKVISYLSGKTEVREETKGADYGGTT